MSSYTLAVKVQNSESLQASCSWKGNVCLSILKYSWQWDFNTVQCHTLKQCSKKSRQAYLTSSHNSLRLRKQPTFCKATTGSPVKWCLRNERKSSILMTYHYPDWVVLLIGWSVSVWLVRSITQIRVVTFHQYEVSITLVLQVLFCGETSSGIVKCRHVFSGYKTVGTNRLSKLDLGFYTQNSLICLGQCNTFTLPGFYVWTLPRLVWVAAVVEWLSPLQLFSLPISQVQWPALNRTWTSPLGNLKWHTTQLQ